ncbi:MAG: hypothetical protein OEZ39_20220 [Gammaproteobacteria bacterium]|nr:hypothetical protein [Gammaproteobacteria bacterium]
MEILKLTGNPKTDAALDSLTRTLARGLAYENLEFETCLIALQGYLAKIGIIDATKLDIAIKKFHIIYTYDYQRMLKETGKKHEIQSQKP